MSAEAWPTRSGLARPTSAAERGQAQVGVVVPKGKPVLGPRSEHPVGFLGSLGHKVVDEDTDVGLVPAQNQRSPALNLSRGVDSGDEPLPGRFLVARGSVELAGKEKAANALGFERRMKLGRWTEIVFDRIARAHDLGLFEARNRADESVLDLEGQAGGAAVDVILVGVAAFGLEEKLVAFLVGEADDLVLQGRAVAGSDALDLPAIEGRLVEIGANDLVGGGGGVGDRAGQLFHVEHSIPPFVQSEDVIRARPQGVGQVAERLGRLVAVLEIHPAEIDTFLEKTRGRTGLEPPQLKAELQERSRQAAGAVAHPSARRIAQAHVHEALQERASCNYNAFR